MAKKTTKNEVGEIVGAIESKETFEPLRGLPPPNFNTMVSTGSTLFDLAISFKRIRGGGIPSGIFVELFGPPASGKTAVLAEIAASAQERGGNVKFLDAEARLDRDYAEIYGLKLPDCDYYRPNTVSELFDLIDEFIEEETVSDVPSIICADSLAALVTDAQISGDDAYGMRRGKEFSEGLRLVCTKIANKGWTIIASNQEREGPGGVNTPGGRAIKYYASLRIRVKPAYPQGKIKISRTVIMGDKKRAFEKVIGIDSVCEVVKSTVDEPYREAPISIVFGYGIDDIRANLTWYKDVTGKGYVLGDEKLGGRIDKAIEVVEAAGLENKLREQVIDAWEEIDRLFDQNRIKKKR